MELDVLKNTWQRAGADEKSEKELNRMTQLTQNPRIRRIKVRMIIEALLSTALITVAITGLDGFQKPLWVTLLLISSGLLFLLNRTVGFQKIKSPQLNGPTKTVSQDILSDLKKISVTTTISALLLGSSLLIFLTINIEFDAEKTYLLLGMIVTMMVLVYASTQIWRNQINHLKKVIEELNENGAMT